MQIREAKLSDFDQIIHILKDHFVHDSQFAPITNNNYPDTDDGKEELAKAIVRDDNIALVIEDNDKILGYLTGAVRDRSWREQTKVAELDGLYLSEDIRNQGWGSKLIDRFKQFARDNNAKALKVMTNYNNSIARSFYEKNGFQEHATWYEQPLE